MIFIARSTSTYCFSEKDKKCTLSDVEKVAPNNFVADSNLTTCHTKYGCHESDYYYNFGEKGYESQGFCGNCLGNDQFELEHPPMKGRQIK